MTQEVCIKLFSVLKTYDPSYLFTTWLYRVTVNHSIDYTRKKARRRSIPISDFDNETVFADNRSLPDNHAERKELRNVIHQPTRSMPERQRSVFIVRDIQEFSTVEVAEILKCKPYSNRGV
ncbi:RNA polymerase sigma factor [Candidatus Latescibacterota bacterium]